MQIAAELLLTPSLYGYLFPSHHVFNVMVPNFNIFGLPWTFGSFKYSRAAMSSL